MKGPNREGPQGRTTGDEPSEAELLAEFDPVIRREAALAHRRCPWADLDDLLQRGAMGLLGAIRSPTRDRARPLAPFAWASIRNAIRNSPEIERGIDHVLAGRVAAAHDSLMAKGVARPTPAEIAEESNRMAAQLRRATKTKITTRDVERGLDMLDFASVVSADKLRESGWEPVAAVDDRARPSPEWLDAFMGALERMLDDCGLNERKVFVAKHLFFGWPLTEDRTIGTTKSVAQALNTSDGNVRQLKMRGAAAIRARLRGCLDDAGMGDAHECLWGILVLLGGMEDEAADLNLDALASAETILAEAHARLSPRACAGSSPAWLADLVGLFLFHIRKAAAT